MPCSREQPDVVFLAVLGITYSHLVSGRVVSCARNRMLLVASKTSGRDFVTILHDPTNPTRRAHSDCKSSFIQAQNLKILLLLFENFCEAAIKDCAALEPLGLSSIFFPFSASFGHTKSARGSAGARKTVVSEPCEVIRSVKRGLESARGMLTVCADNRRVFFGFPGETLSLDRSEPTARFPRRRRRPAGRTSCNSKSVGRNAVGAL